MKKLKKLHVIQFSFWDVESFVFDKDCTGIIGANGAGKTTLIDAIQIALVGANKQHMHFNAQSVQKDSRLLRDYALGAMRSGDSEDQKQSVITRKREEALSYITLIFKGDQPSDTVSAGICIHSTATDRDHKVLGLYVLPGVELQQDDHLESRGAEGRAPMDWAQFEALIRGKAKGVGLTPTITTKPEAYLSELLHSIQDPERHIDRNQFLRALKHSINLKQVDGVGVFLRKYLVESTPIDKQGTLLHIKTMRLLARKIEEIKNQIARLQSIGKRFESVRHFHQQKAVAAAVRLTLQVEAADTNLSNLGMELDRLGDEIRTGQSNLTKLKKDTELMKGLVEDLIRQQASDPEILKSIQADQIGNLNRQAAESSKRTLLKIENKVRIALSAVAAELEFRKHTDSLVFREFVEQLDEHAASGPIASTSLIGKAFAALAKIKPDLFKYDESALIAIDEAKRAYESANERLKASAKGMRLELDDSISEAMSIFRSEDIDCATVASLVRITDVKWQGVIESFLARNRYALVVDPGREQDAVHLLRASRRPLYGVTVVQPRHLQEDLHRHYESNSVAALITGDHPVALAFLRRMLGALRQVESEQDLEKHPRSMTQDGMLSANGGTTRLRLIEPQLWSLGVQISSVERIGLENELREADRAWIDAKSIRNRTKTAIEELQSAITAYTIEEYEAAIDAMNIAFVTMSAAGAISSSEKAQSLAEKLKAATIARQAADQAVLDQTELLATKTEANRVKVIERDAAKLQFIDLSAKCQMAHEEQDYDAEAASTLYNECQSKNVQLGVSAAMEHLASKIIHANKRISTDEPQVHADFITYINEQAIALVEERSDWRLAAVWVSTHTQRLVNSTLSEYEGDAAQARSAAEQAFKADVKFKMREAIHRVQQEIGDLNRILDKCPEFTGGERYRFSHEISPMHRDLYELILSDADAGQPSFLDATDNDGTQGKLVTLLEACESGDDKGNNPLEDYRLLFNFDLKIIVNGMVVDKLSKRMGVASNGEHRVPFYVIAGAALASAYRIKPGAQHRGAGLMLLDEAFYGMDAQNSFVTAEFLKSLGLQLILAGPDTDVGKLIPVLDSYYDVFRPDNGADAYFSHVQIKEAAKTLLQSDIPEMHPHLVEQKMQQLSMI
ncbi:SbcC/MukB-like Walker B domain-containing protein [Undibacterium luofuense]|uniref:AAA family ATPase n=1 Tax=Undibacterium luofuense TaxID=2828733 RepID=A0A941I594_9BURK|nr:SbcC/MukB-like Walker B domain-containing protein [Undibacterium luofuense]MBR7780624.1 AAA family ATPase [Undibacterium luofuense]